MEEHKRDRPQLPPTQRTRRLRPSQAAEDQNLIHKHGVLWRRIDDHTLVLAEEDDIDETIVFQDS